MCSGPSGPPTTTSRASASTSSSVALGAKLDAVLRRCCARARGRSRDAEGRLRRDDHHHADVVEHPLRPPVVAGLVHRLLRGAAARCGFRRLGEDDGSACDVAQQARRLRRKIVLIVGGRRRRLRAPRRVRERVPSRSWMPGQTTTWSYVTRLPLSSITEFASGVDRGDGILDPHHPLRNDVAPAAARSCSHAPFPRRRARTAACRRASRAARRRRCLPLPSAAAGRPPRYRRCLRRSRGSGGEWWVSRAWRSVPSQRRTPPRYVDG